MGAIEHTCVILASLMRGEVVDRHSLARARGITVASADRYLRAMYAIPGVTLRKHGRVLRASFSFGDALKAVGR